MTRPGPGVRTRIALTSGGSLHLGGARLALLNWLAARRHGGQVLLRLGEAAAHPGRAELAGSAEQDLAWLGLDWETTIRPAERQERYAAVAEALRRAGRIYPCLESEDELRAKRDWRIRRGKPAVYDRAMLKLTAAQLAAAEAGGKRPYWRFRLSDGEIGWTDLVRGATRVKLPSLSDPVVVQADGGALPNLTAVVDDLDFGITHIIHGADHVERTGLQLELFAAIGGDPAALRLAHVPQLADSDAGGRGARSDAVTLRRLRGDGMEPAAITGYLAALGAGHAARLAPPIDLAASFDLAGCARAAAPFDITALQALNRQALRETSFAAVAGRLPQGATEAFWAAIAGSIELLREAAGWWDVVAGTIIPPVIEDEAGFLRIALALLPPEPWPADIWPQWSSALREATGRDLDAVTAPVRLALTGEDHGPDLTALLPLIGRARAAQRLQLAAA